MQIENKKNKTIVETEDGIDLVQVWSEIVTEAAVPEEDVEAAKTQISQADGDKDDFAFQKAFALAQTGDLTGVLAWIEAEDKLPEEKLNRAKYLIGIVNGANIRMADQVASMPGAASVLGKIVAALEKLAYFRNK